MRVSLFNPAAVSPIVAFVLSMGMAAAQPATGSLEGVVTDPSKSSVPATTITILRAQQVVNTTHTDTQGRYSVPALPPGKYTVRTVATGFAQYQSAPTDVTAGGHQILNIALILVAQSDKVTVEAETQAKVDTDPANNAGALVLHDTELDALADDPDDLAADLLALAGPGAGPNGGQIFIDGFTGGRLPAKRSIREVRINQNPFAAQFDKPGNGRIEIFTKPGTDEFHGNVAFQVSDALFNSRNPFVTEKPPYQRRQWEGELSGPLNKKTSFFFDFERRDISENAFVNAFVLDPSLHITPFTQAVVQPVANDEVNFKIDRQLTSNHTLTARYTYARDANDNQGVGGFSLPERAYNVRGSEDTIQVIETGVLNVHTINETRLRFRRQTNDQSGGTAAPTISVLDSFSSGGSPVGTSFNDQNRYELQNFTSHVLGTHAVRWGGLVRGVSLTDQAMQNYLGTFTFTSIQSYQATLIGIKQGLTAAQISALGGGPSQFTLAAGNPLAALNQFDFGLFVMDDWRARPNLTISAGLRYEAQTNSKDRSDIAPRVGFAWGLGSSKGGAAKNVIRGGFGIFYDRLSESLTLTALRQNGINQQQYLVPNPDFFPTVPSAATLRVGALPQTVRETDSHWQAPQLLQSAIGYERQLPKHITVTTNYVHSNGNHQLRSRNINAPLAGNTRPFGGNTAIYLYETSAVFRQNQLNTSVTARVSSKLTFNASYVYGRAFNNSDGAGAFPANQYDLSTEYGRAFFDVRHRVSMNGSLATRWGLRFSPLVTMESGRPFNITTGTDGNGDGLYTDRPSFTLDPSLPGVVSTPYGLLNPNPGPGATVIPRNLGNGPGLVTANLRVSKSFNLGETKSGKDPRQITLSVNARNILNHPNFASPDGNLSSPFFGHSTALVNGGSASANRRLDLQLRFSF